MRNKSQLPFIVGLILLLLIGGSRWSGRRTNKGMFWVLFAQG
jgi:hypothetical protein